MQRRLGIDTYKHLWSISYPFLEWTTIFYHFHWRLLALWLSLFDSWEVSIIGCVQEFQSWSWEVYLSFHAKQRIWYMCSSYDQPSCKRNKLSPYLVYSAHFSLMSQKLQFVFLYCPSFFSCWYQIPDMWKPSEHFLSFLVSISHSLVHTKQ